MQTVFVLLVVELFAHFIFLSRRGTYHFAHVFLFFFFSLLVVQDELASPGKMLWRCDHGSAVSIHFGIGHITGWSIGDWVRQMALLSQQANLDVIICQDDVISKNYCCFRIPYGQLPINRHQTRYVHLLLAHFFDPLITWNPWNFAILNILMSFRMSKKIWIDTKIVIIGHFYIF